MSAVGKRKLPGIWHDVIFGRKSRDGSLCGELVAGNQIKGGTCDGSIVDQDRIGAVDISGNPVALSVSGGRISNWLVQLINT